MYNYPRRLVQSIFALRGFQNFPVFSKNFTEVNYRNSRTLYEIDQQIGYRFLHIKRRLFKTCKDYLSPGLIVCHIENGSNCNFIIKKLERVSCASTSLRNQIIWPLLKCMFQQRLAAAALNVRLAKLTAKQHNVDESITII